MEPLPTIIPDQLRNAIPSTIEQEVGVAEGQDSAQSPTQNLSRHNDGKLRRTRSKWTQEETQDLIKGCNIHGVGSWKKILEDASLKFNNRTSVDLKDRFRTYFPEDYKRLYPNATSTRERATAQTLAPEAAGFAKAKRKDRTPFTKDEDTNLLIGFGKYGGKWSSIQKDESLGLSHRRSTDLRDRFRNAFPEKYVGAGFKPPPAKKRRPDDVHSPSTAAMNPTSQQTQAVYEFHTDVAPPTMQEPTIPTPVRREQIAAAIAASQSTGDTFSHTRLAWTNPHNAAMAKEMEMAMKLRRALDMSNASEMMGDTEIPLDPGLSDVAYQPHGQSHDTEAITGLLDAAAAWKRDHGQ